MPALIQHILQGLEIIRQASARMSEDADRRLQNLAPPGWTPVTGSDLIQSNIEAKYADDFSEMQELAIDRYTGSITSAGADRLEELLENYGEGTGGIRLLLTGNYASHFLEQGTALDFDQVEANANAFNGGDSHVVIQSIFDPVVADKPLTVDEYSVNIVLPEGTSPEDFLAQMATDMDESLGSEFGEAGNFENQGNTPEVGQIIEIDVKDVPSWFAKLPFIADESPINAPVLISNMSSDHFTVQTLELNGKEHPLHGTRQWGYEEQPDGSYKFYTRGISVEDTFLAEQGARGGEYNMWNRWVDGVEGFATDQGGSVVADSRISDQSTGPSANELWDTLTPSQQGTIQHEQIQNLQREVDRLGHDLEGAIYEDQIHIEFRIREINGEIAGWEDR